MGKIDAATKAYMENSAHFADAFNYLIYNGEPVIQPSELTPLDTTELVIPYGNGVSEPEQKFRDVLKLWYAMRDEKAVYAVLGAENQAYVHYAMPVRCFLYDGLNYAGQVEQVKIGCRTGESSGNRISGAEFLSGFRKEDRLLPVITLVIYFGTSEWDGPTSLHEMLCTGDETLLRMVPDYRLNLIAPSRMEEADFLKFQTDLGKVLEYIKCAGDRKKLDELVHRDDRYKNVERESAELINTVTGSTLQLAVKEEKIDMCKAIEDMRNEALKKGREEGLEKGREEGLEKGREEGLKKGREEGLKKGREEATSSYLVKMIHNLNCTLDDAMRALGLSLEEREKYANLL